MMRMREHVGLWVVLGLVGCGGARGGAPAGGTSAGASASTGPACAATAEAVTKVIATEAPVGDREAVQARVAQRCADDRWTAEARACLAAASSTNAQYECGYNHLTQAQHVKLDGATEGLSSEGADRALATMERFRDQMCACRDAACAQDVSDDMTKWSQEMSRQNKRSERFSEAQTQRAAGIGERMGECLQIALSAGPPAAAPAPLRVTGLQPDHGSVRGGTKVTISGSSFTGEPRTAKVYFGDKPAKNVKIASDGELTVEAPAGKANQRVDVLVVFEPGGELKIAGGYTYDPKNK